MRKLGAWAILALLLSIVSTGGCGGPDPEKAAGKPAKVTLNSPENSPAKSTETPAAGAPHGDMPAGNEKAAKGESVAAADAPKGTTASDTPTPSKEPVKNDSATPSGPGTKPAPKIAQAPVPAPITGPVPVPMKIDPAVQKRVLAIAEKMNAVSVKKAAEGNLEKNDFKQIALAFHNFHDSTGQFPALNGSGKKDEPHPGLSWRVYLLPYLEQGELYNEFKLDEAWDSEHNKALIAKIPKIYGTHEEGKSRVHLLTGNGAPFKNDLGTGMREILDGTSNTLLCVEAGADKAEIWTKPGGLEFDPKDPFKCLGKVGDEFLVAMMDGSVRTVAKSIKPESLSFLVQNADGNPIPNDALAATPSEVGPKLKVVDPVTPLGPATPRFDLSYIPEDAFFALVLHPRRVYSHPIIQGIRNQAPEGFFPTEPNEIPYDARMGLSQVNEFSSWLGIAPQNLDDVMILLDQSFPDAAVKGFSEGAAKFGVLIRNSAPIDVEGALMALGKKAHGVQALEFEGVTLLASPDQTGCIAFISDSMFIVGEVEFVKKMIAAREQATATSVLTKRLEAAGNKLFVLAVDGTPAADAVKHVAGQIPPPVSLFSAYFLGAEELGLVIDLDAPAMLELTLQFKTEELATGLYGILDQNWTWAKEQYGQFKESISNEPLSAPLRTYADQLIAESNLTKAGVSVAFTVPKLKDLDKLPERLKPVFEQAKKAAEEQKQMNGLKQIGLAFHNYHDGNKCFPALNGPGPKDSPHPGLSWRVYLLPYLEEVALYQEFKLDEAWDSEHNKPLIAKMPKIFGVNKEGKTRMHVFTGTGAPFQNDAGPGIQNITDGTSNTVLVVEAGEDVADFWTKPGGLEFDPENPLKCLGAIKEFSVVLMDGSVRRLKNINADTFRRLVQFSDGEVVGEF